MRLILKENSFKFDDKHMQGQEIAIDTKMAVYSFRSHVDHIEKQLLTATLHKPIL